MCCNQAAQVTNLAIALALGWQTLAPAGRTFAPRHTPHQTCPRHVRPRVLPPNCASIPCAQATPQTQRGTSQTTLTTNTTRTTTPCETRDWPAPRWANSRSRLQLLNSCAQHRALRTVSPRDALTRSASAKVWQNDIPSNAQRHPRCTLDPSSLFRHSSSASWNTSIWPWRHRAGTAASRPWEWRHASEQLTKVLNRMSGFQAYPQGPSPAEGHS